MMAQIQTRQRRRERGLQDDVPRCSKCDQPNDRAPQRYCRSCHAAYARDWRQTHRATSESRLKGSALALANAYLLNGKIKRDACCVCGNSESEMHHPDYGRPLHVYWLCRKHHLDWHRHESVVTSAVFEAWLPHGAKPAELNGVPAWAKNDAFDYRALNDAFVVSETNDAFGNRHGI